MQENLGMDGNKTPINQAIRQQIVTEIPNNSEKRVEKENFWKRFLKKFKTENKSR